MAKEQVVEAVQTEQEVTAEEEAVTVVAELTIKALSNGNLEVNVPEGARELQPIEVEGIVRSVYDQLRDMRIAQTAVELFKSRLG